MKIEEAKELLEKATLPSCQWCRGKAPMSTFDEAEHEALCRFADEALESIPPTLKSFAVLILAVEALKANKIWHTKPDMTPKAECVHDCGACRRDKALRAFEEL